MTAVRKPFPDTHDHEVVVVGKDDFEVSPPVEVERGQSVRGSKERKQQRCSYNEGQSE